MPRQDWQFADLVVRVPRSLSVSEAYGFKPRADIVWRADPPTVRHVQVTELMRSAIEPASAAMQGDEVAVQITVEVSRFHAVTERARYTTGGQHEIDFVYTVRHAGSGALLAGPGSVELSFRAVGGRRALEAERQRITQRVRLDERLAG